MTRVDATNTHEVESTRHDDNDKRANKEVNRGEAAEKDIDPDWKPYLNDVHDELEDDEIEYDEDEHPLSKVHKGAPEVMAASLSSGLPTEDADSNSDEDYFPALDDEMDHSDFIHHENVPIVTSHNEL
jgi:hypothetical protein